VNAFGQPRWPRPDFLDDAHARPRRGRALFAIGGVLALCAAAQYAWWQQSEFDRLTQPAPAAQRSAARAAAAPRGAAPSADVEARRAANRVVAALDHPWGTVLATLESATPSGVQWLSLDHIQASGELRLEGDAVDAGAALGIVDRLAARPGWLDVVLVRWQRGAESGGVGSVARPAAEAASAAPLRFAIEATLGPGLATEPAVVP
jgi:hypothetical protein